MIIVCQECNSRLQVDETKVPSRSFSVRCPKCNSNINSGATPTAAVGHSALALGESPATGNPRLEHPPLPAPPFELETKSTEIKSAAPATERLAELLADLLNQQARTVSNAAGIRPSWNPRKTLICVPEDTREKVARSLAENGLQVFVAQDTSQAVERMRENQLISWCLIPDSIRLSKARCSLPVKSPCSDPHNAAVCSLFFYHLRCAQWMHMQRF